jgi:hypothetical protein
MTLLETVVLYSICPIHLWDLFLWRDYHPSVDKFCCMTYSGQFNVNGMGGSAVFLLPLSQGQHISGDSFPISLGPGMKSPVQDK